MIYFSKNVFTNAMMLSELGGFIIMISYHKNLKVSHGYPEFYIFSPEGEIW